MEKIKNWFKEKSKDKKTFIISITKILIFVLCIMSGLFFIIFSNLKELKWYDWTFFVDIFIGITGLFLLGQKYKYSFIILIFDAFLFGASLIGQGDYASGIVNITIIPIILSIPFFNKSYKDEEFETKSLKNSSNIILLASIIAISTILYFTVGAIMNATQESNLERKHFLLWVDLLLSIFTVVAFYFSVFKYKEAWVYFIMINLIRTIMFTTLIAMQNSDTSPLSLMIAITYFINGILGWVNWRTKE